MLKKPQNQWPIEDNENLVVSPPVPHRTEKCKTLQEKLLTSCKQPVLFGLTCDVMNVVSREKTGKRKVAILDSFSLDYQMWIL